ncbi:hypothetical protein T484DRAFT_1773263 [Baffinella frigidus]|nr:hypothetical protein T484DRAFT_1773263 [Cryptophyta sp. CCMP2293]
MPEYELRVWAVDEYELRVWAVDVMATTYGEGSPLTDLMREKLVKALIANGRIDQGAIDQVSL